MKVRIISGVILILTLFAGFAKPAEAAVAFNTFPISYTPQLNKDLPLMDARNLTAGGQFSTSQADHDNGVQANPGDTIEFQIYYHNTGTPEGIAHNVIIKANLPGGSRKSHEVSATIDSDEISPVSSSDAFHGGNITINIAGTETQTLELVPGSVWHFPNRTVSGTNLGSAGNVLTTSGLNIGNIQGCFEFSGFVNFKAKVGQQQVSQEQRDLSIEKRVLNVTKGQAVFQESVVANPGEKVKFEVRFSTSGNASQNNVIVRDILPNQLTFVAGSLRQDGSSVAAESEFFGSGRNLGSLSTGIARTFVFEANVAAAGSFTAATTLINTANVRSDEVSTRQDTAQVVVQLVAGIQFQQRKTAFNLTQGVDATTVAASPGDVIVYSLIFKNTGQTTITNVVIDDDIRDILELATITNSGGAISVNGNIKFAGVDIPSGVEITRTFQVRVRPVSEFPASSDLVMINIFGNEIRVSVRKPQVAAAVVRPPVTGASEWLVVAMATLSTAFYWTYRRKILSTKSEIRNNI